MCMHTEVIVIQLLQPIRKRQALFAPQFWWSSSGILEGIRTIPRTLLVTEDMTRAKVKLGIQLKLYTWVKELSNRFMDVVTTVLAPFLFSVFLRYQNSHDSATQYRLPSCWPIREPMVHYLRIRLKPAPVCRLGLGSFFVALTTHLLVTAVLLGMCRSMYAAK